MGFFDKFPAPWENQNPSGYPSNNNFGNNHGNNSNNQPHNGPPQWVQASLKAATSNDGSDFLKNMPPGLIAQMRQQGPQNPQDQAWACNWRWWYEFGLQTCQWFHENGWTPPDNNNGNPVNPHGTDPITPPPPQNCTFTYPLPPGGDISFWAINKPGAIIQVNVPTLGSTTLTPSSNGNAMHDPAGQWNHRFGRLGSAQTAQVDLTVNGKPECLTVTKYINNGVKLSYSGGEIAILHWGPP